MIFKLLVRNYYETHGSFEGIDKVKFIDDLNKECDKQGKDLLVYCYECLGYSPVILSTGTMIDTLTVVGILRGEDGEIQNQLKSTVLTKEEYVELFNKLPHSIIKPTKRVKEKNTLLIDMLIEYYKISTSSVKVGESSMPLGLYLNSLRVTASSKNKSTAEAIIKNKDFADALVKVRVSDTEYPLISNNFLCIPKELADTINIKELNFKAMHKLLSGVDFVPSNIYKSPADLIFFSVKSNKKYLTLLDHLSKHNMTYKDFCELESVNVPDIVNQYETHGVIFIRMWDSFLYCDSTCTEKNPLISCTEETLLNKLNNIAMTTASMEVFS